MFDRYLRLVVGYFIFGAARYTSEGIHDTARFLYSPQYWVGEETKLRAQTDDGFD